MQEEIWKAIPGYEGYYEVSDQGNVRSLDRKVWTGKGYYLKKGEVMKFYTTDQGYYRVVLSKNSNVRKFKVHQLVAMAFLGHKPNRYKGLIVDHISNIKTDNRLENLQLISQRENVSKDIKNGSSKYTGVSWNKAGNKWVSFIRVNGKKKYLGYFKCELAAAAAYQKELIKLNK